MVKPVRQRLDDRLQTLGLAASPREARGLIMAGRVLVADRPVDKPGTLVTETAALRLRGEPRNWVSRGGDKLAHALTRLDIDVTGVQALDVGASTGGFTEVLLSRGAARVIAMDVGYGQLDQRLARDDRVTVMDRCNARGLTPEGLPYTVDFITMDVSFISVALLLPIVLNAVTSDCAGVLLIKPQFELPRDQVPDGGVVTDPALHAQAEAMVQNVCHTLEAKVLGVVPSPIPGARGNREFLLGFNRVPRKGGFHGR